MLHQVVALTLSGYDERTNTGRVVLRWIVQLDCFFDDGESRSANTTPLFTVYISPRLYGACFIPHFHPHPHPMVPLKTFLDQSNGSVYYPVRASYPRFSYIVPVTTNERNANSTARTTIAESTILLRSLSFLLFHLFPFFPLVFFSPPCFQSKQNKQKSQVESPRVPNSQEFHSLRRILR